LLTGCLATYWHLTLLPDLGRLFADGGWLPAEAVHRLEPRGGSLTYLDYIASPGSLVAAHLAGLLVLALFTLGFYSRLTSILALVVILADVHRGPMLTSQFEPVLTMVMCYLCLGPSGASWSLQVHLAMLVAMMGMSKLMGGTWWQGMAVWWLVARPESRLVDLTWLGEYAVNFWTHAIMALELAFPILVWVPLLRPLMLALAALVWISLALLTGQVTFVLMMLVASLSYCSPAWLRSCCLKAAEAKQPAASAAAVS
jgi:hypothetical protein